MVLAITAEIDWEVRQRDVKTAFLYADIEEDVFVAEPPGFETQGKNEVPFVMILGKSPYGLAHSPGNWFHTIDPVLISIGFVQLKFDTCIYIYDHDEIIITFTQCRRSPCYWRRYPVDREVQEEADGSVHDD